MFYFDTAARDEADDVAKAATVKDRGGQIIKAIIAANDAVNGRTHTCCIHTCCIYTHTHTNTPPPPPPPPQSPRFTFADRKPRKPKASDTSVFPPLLTSCFKATLADVGLEVDQPTPHHISASNTNTLMFTPSHKNTCVPPHTGRTCR